MLRKLRISWKNFLKHRLWKNRALGQRGTDKLFFDQIFNFCLHNIIVRKVLNNFCFWDPLDSFTGWRSTQYQVEDQGFLVLQVSRTWKNSIFSRINRFDLKSFLVFRATHALRFYALSVVGELQVNFLCSFETVFL